MRDMGWIVLHRKLLDWEWYDDEKTLKVFLHCMLRANHKDTQWRGIEVKKGEFVTSQAHLAAETNFTVKQIRSILNKLKRTGEVAVKTTNKYSIISMTKWEDYQDKGRQTVRRRADGGQAKGNQRATDNNDNNGNNENKNIYTQNTCPKIEETDSDSVQTKPNKQIIPFQAIVDLYHELLPTLPTCQKLTPKRKGQIRQRWIEDMPEMKNWQNFFKYVAQSDFLMGRVPSNNGRPPFRADIEWLTNATNFTKISEKKYHG